MRVPRSVLPLGILGAVWACGSSSSSAPDASTGHGSDSVTPTDGGSEASPNAVTPTCDATDVCTFAWGAYKFVVDGGNGARIIEFSLSGTNAILSEAAACAAGAADYGATFWPSPQNGDGGWGWPPIAEIDTGPYTVSVVGSALHMTSGSFTVISGDPTMTVEKVFSVNAASGVVTIDYMFHNTGTAPISVAPWEITRVAAGGLTFFPNPTSAPATSGCSSFTPQPVTTLDGYTFFADDAATFADASTDQGKFCTDGGSKGYEAHLSGNQLLVQAWSDVPASENVPGEGEDEFYTDPSLSYEEMENQGPYSAIAAGSSSSWTVRWSLSSIASFDAGADAAAFDWASILTSGNGTLQTIENAADTQALLQ
jgi:hypothetical protein